MMTGRSRSGPKPLTRRVAVLRPRKTLLVFCEGRRTEPEYLQALRRLPAVREVAAVEIRLDRDCGGCKPLYMPKRRTAAARAAELDRRHVKNGVLMPEDNPSSGMHRLIASVEVVG